MVLSDGHLWVVDNSANEVVELNASDASLIRIVDAESDRFDEPSDISSSGRYLWVTSSQNVTQLNASNGSLVRVLRAAKYHFDFPGSIVFGDSHIWMTNGGNTKNDSSVVELDPESGSLVRVIELPGPSNPEDLTIFGTRLWVTNSGNDTVEEFSASTGSLIRTLDGSNYHFDEPWGIASTGRDLWVSNAEGRYSMTEINGSTGALVRVVKRTNAWLRNANQVNTGASPSGLAVDGSDVWIANGANVVEVRASTGQLVRVVTSCDWVFQDSQNVVAGGQSIWASSLEAGVVVQLNATTGQVVRLVQSRSTAPIQGGACQF